VAPLAVQPLNESTLPVWTTVKVWPAWIPTSLAAVQRLEVERIDAPFSGQPITAPVQVSTTLQLTRYDPPGKNTSRNDVMHEEIKLTPGSGVVGNAVGTIGVGNAVGESVDATGNGVGDDGADPEPTQSAEGEQASKFIKGGVDLPRDPNCGKESDPKKVSQIPAEPVDP